MAYTREQLLAEKARRDREKALKEFGAITKKFGTFFGIEDDTAPLKPVRYETDLDPSRLELYPSPMTMKAPIVPGVYPGKGPGGAPRVTGAGESRLGYLEEALMLPYRPIGAWLRASVDIAFSDRPLTDFPAQFAERLVGPRQELYGKEITEPVAKDILKRLPPEIAYPAGALYYGAAGAGYDVTPEHLALSVMKTAAARGDIPAEPSDLPAQFSPAGVINVGIESLGLDMLIGGGPTRLAINAGKEGGEALIKSAAKGAIDNGFMSVLDKGAVDALELAAKNGTMPAQKSAKAVMGFHNPIIFGGKPLISPLEAGVWYRNVERFGSELLENKTITRIVGAFVKHVGPTAPIRKLIDEVLIKSQAWIGRAGVDEAAIAQEVTKVLKVNNIPEDEARRVITDIVETFGAKKTPEAVNIEVGGLVEWADLGAKPQPPGTITESVLESWPTMSTKDADSIAGAVDHYMHLGPNIALAEMWEGIPLKRLAVDDKNYILHYATDEFRKAMGPTGRTFAKAAPDARLAADIFHPSLKGRQLDMTIKEINDLATQGKAYVQGGKLGILDEGAPLPLGAESIGKVFEDDPARLALIRKTRAIRAITGKQFLDEAFKITPESTEKGAVTLKGMLGIRLWSKTFGTLGEDVSKYGDRLIDKNTANAILHGVHRMQGFANIEKGVFTKAYDAVLNFWKPIQLYLYPKYYNRNQISAMWNEVMNDNFDGMMAGYADIFQRAKDDILAKKMPSLKSHPKWQEALDNGLFNRTQSTADMERGILFGEAAADSVLGDIKQFAIGVGTLGVKGDIGKAATLQENLIRFASYLGWDMKGYTPRSAVKKVFQSQFDYLDLTDWEWNVARRVVPFYTWSRKNIPFQLQRIAERPGKATVPMRMFRRGSLEISKEEEETLREDIKGRFPIKVGDNQYIPLEDTWSLMDIMKIPKAAEEFVQAMSPLVKLPLELGATTVEGRVTGWRGPFNIGWGVGEKTGFNLFTERPIAKWYQPTDDVWGVKVPNKLAHIFKNSFRMVREIEKSPWYPEDEERPLGQPEKAKTLQMLGIPFYENRPQQQIYWNIRDIENKQEESGSFKSNPRKWTKLELEKIYNYGLQDKYMEPFRGKERDIHTDAAVMSELSARYGVDVATIRKASGTGWKGALLEAMGTEATSNNLMTLNDDIKAIQDEVITKGGVELYQTTLAAINGLLTKDRQSDYKLLEPDERKWVENAMIANYLNGINYLDSMREDEKATWYDYKGKLKEWTDNVQAYTNTTPTNIYSIYQKAATDDFAKYKDIMDTEPSTDNFNRMVGQARRYSESPFISQADKDAWRETMYNTQNTHVTWLWMNGERDSALDKMQRMIKDDTMPMTRRKQLGKTYALYVQQWMGVDPKKKSLIPWMEEWILPLFQAE